MKDEDFKITVKEPFTVYGIEGVADVKAGDVLCVTRAAPRKSQTVGRSCSFAISADMLVAGLAEFIDSKGEAARDRVMRIYGAMRRKDSQ